jgi:hypothetical protein
MIAVGATAAWIGMYATDLVRTAYRDVGGFGLPSVAWLGQGRHGHPAGCSVRLPGG